MATDEKVLCVERRRLEDLGTFQGLSLDVERYRPLLDEWKRQIDLPRSEAEHDENYKQLIPYVLVFHQDRILRYQRGRGSGEKRLLGCYSVGVGGHIAREDSNLYNQSGYQEAMLREIREEVRLDASPGWSMESVAVINDDSTEVGRVHLGVVHVMQAQGTDCVGRRSGILRPEFLEWRRVAQESRERPGRYESWSALCLERMEELIDRAVG